MIKLNQKFKKLRKKENSHRKLLQRSKLITFKNANDDINEKNTIYPMVSYVEFGGIEAIFTKTIKK